MTTPAVTQAPSQQTQPAQPQTDQQLAMQIALALSAAVTVADALVALTAVMAAFRIRAAMMSAVLGIIMGMPPEPKLIEEMHRLGASCVLRWIPSGGLSVVERGVERWEAAIADFTGEA